MSENSVLPVDKRQHVFRPPEQSETYLEGAPSESKGANDSIQERLHSEDPSSTHSSMAVDLDENNNNYGTIQCVSQHQSQEELKTPVYSPRVLLPFKSLSLLDSPSDMEKAAITEVSGGLAGTTGEKNSEVRKERESNGFFFSNVTTPKPFQALTPIYSDATWSDPDERSPARISWKKIESDPKSQTSKKVVSKVSMKCMKHNMEDPLSKTQSEGKAPKIDIPKQIERQTSGSFVETPCSETDISELQPFNVRPELLCGFDSLSKLDSPIQKVKGESGNLSTYIERRDSLLKGLVADGGTRDFALWFDRLGPGLHCNQDFHTETGIFNQDFWHNPFARSKSFDKYLGLTADD